MKKILILFRILFSLQVCLFLTSCLEAEIEIDLKRDGSGEMRMKILPLEVSLNSMIDLVEADLKEKQDIKGSDITRRIESDGRNSLFTRKKFKSIEEADENCRFVSHKDHDEFTMSVPYDFLGIVKKVKVNMPGPIIESNMKNFKGKSLLWDRTLSSGNKLIIKSKTSESIGEIVTLIIIALLVVGGVAIFIFKKIRNHKIVSQQYNFCPECGTKNKSNNNFCQSCGQRLK